MTKSNQINQFTSIKKLTFFLSVCRLLNLDIMLIYEMLDAKNTCTSFTKHWIIRQERFAAQNWLVIQWHHLVVKTGTL